MSPNNHFTRFSATPESRRSVSRPGFLHTLALGVEQLKNQGVCPAAEGRLSGRSMLVASHKTHDVEELHLSIAAVRSFVSEFDFEAPYLVEVAFRDGPD